MKRMFVAAVVSMLEKCRKVLAVHNGIAKDTGEPNNMQ